MWVLNFILELLKESYVLVKIIFSLREGKIIFIVYWRLVCAFGKEGVKGGGESSL